MFEKILCENPTVAAQKAAEAVSEIIAGYKNLSILFLVSGGSPLEIVKYLPVFDSQVTVTVSDERFSTDPAINNFMQIQSIRAEHWIDTRPLQGESLQECGQRFDASLKQWKQEHPDGKIVITQGIGLDGHTAGMMIGCVFDDPAAWAVGYDAKEKNKYPLRVTTTMPFLRMVDDSVLYVCGQDKKKPLQDTLSARGPLAEVPARIIHEMKHCLLFTDLSI